MTEQDLSNLDNTESSNSDNPSEEAFREETPFRKIGDFSLAQNLDQSTAQVPEEFKQFLEMLMQGGSHVQESQEPKERQSEGMKLFDQTVKGIDQETIDAFKEKRPAFRQAIEQTDSHLNQVANEFVLEQYESGRLDRLITGRQKIREGVKLVSEQLKKIPLHTTKVSTIDLINGYLDPDTDQDTKTVLLERIEGETNSKLASTVKDLGNTQEELRPDIETEIEKRAYVHQAFAESMEAKQIYAGMLNHTMKSPLVDAGESQKMAEEVRTLRAKAHQNSQTYSLHARPPGSIDSFRIKFPKPKAPRTIYA